MKKILTLLFLLLPSIGFSQHIFVNANSVGSVLSSPTNYLDDVAVQFGGSQDCQMPHLVDQDAGGGDEHILVLQIRRQCRVGAGRSFFQPEREGQDRLLIGQVAKVVGRMRLDTFATQCFERIVQCLCMSFMVLQKTDRRLK